MNLRENISIKNIITKVELDDTVNKLSEGLDSKLGSWFGGTELSGGQWQKVAIARTLLREGQINILDEPTSALDPISEHKLFDLAKKEGSRNIKIFISHRLANIARLNSRIIMLKDGDIVADGYHEDIFKDNINYRNMYISQTKDI